MHLSWWGCQMHLLLIPAACCCCAKYKFASFIIIIPPAATKGRSSLREYRTKLAGKTTALAAMGELMARMHESTPL